MRSGNTAVGAAPRLLRWATLFALIFSSAAWAGDSAETLYASSGIHSVRVSPNGLWIAAVARRGDEWGVLVQRVGSDQLVGLPTSQSVGELAWESADTLIFEAHSWSDQIQTHVVRLRFVDGKIVMDRSHLSGWGELVDALPTIPDEVVWAIAYRTRSETRSNLSRTRTALYRVSLSELVERKNDDPVLSMELVDPIARILGPASHWVVDQQGRPRAALRHDEPGYSLMAPDPVTGSFAPVYRFDEMEGEKAIVPVGLTAQGSRLVVLAYHGRNTKGLYEFDPVARTFGPPLYVHDRFDVRDVVRDPLTGDLVAAVYDEKGIARHHYFPAYHDRFMAKLPEQWRRPSLRILNGTADRQVFVFLESSDTEPGTYYVRDRAGAVNAIGRVQAGIDPKRLSPVRTFRVNSSDDVDIEAYLTVPRDRTGPVPLVVMPHGGPFGVRDYRDFDPQIQYLASWGFAVLQMNFRGSSGFGLEHEARVKKQWARGIEDDIDAAVEHAMALPEIDGRRLCIVGGSYGGFSALASTIRHPDRFRCAVSIAGVTDVPLMLHSTDFADTAQGIAYFKAYIGDPEKERESLLEISPAYHADQISPPVLLIQGTEDRRVDRDHAHRLALMLELYRKPFEMVEIEGAVHGFDRDESIIVARTIRRFLTKHLHPGTEFEPDPES